MSRGIFPKALNQDKTLSIRLSLLSYLLGLVTDSILHSVNLGICLNVLPTKGATILFKAKAVDMLVAFAMACTVGAKGLYTPFPITLGAILLSPSLYLGVAKR